MRSRVGQVWTYGNPGDDLAVYVIVGLPKMQRQADHWRVMHPAVSLTGARLLHNIGETSNHTLEDSEAVLDHRPCRRIA